MIRNQSAPPGAVVPSLAYADVARAISWLCAAFGFTERLQTPAEPDGSIHHAQLAMGTGAAILTTQTSAQPRDVIMVRVTDIDAHCARARAYGAKIVAEPRTTEFGERQYGAEDLEGRRWVFTESMADVLPASWGAQVVDMHSSLAALPRPRVCYLQIPALDVKASAAFYEEVFGWNIRNRDSAHPSFDDATGNVSGSWFAGRTPHREPGLIVSIWVDDIHATLAKVQAHGGEVVDEPQPDSPAGDSLIANFRDPAGNLIGLYQEVSG